MILAANLFKASKKINFIQMNTNINKILIYTKNILPLYFGFFLAFAIRFGWLNNILSLHSAVSYTNYFVSLSVFSVLVIVYSFSEVEDKNKNINSYKYGLPALYSVYIKTFILILIVLFLLRLEPTVSRIFYILNFLLSVTFIGITDKLYNSVKNKYNLRFSSKKLCFIGPKNEFLNLINNSNITKIQNIDLIQVEKINTQNVSKLFKNLLKKKSHNYSDSFILYDNFLDSKTLNCILHEASLYLKTIYLLPSNYTEWNNSVGIVEIGGVQLISYQDYELNRSHNRMLKRCIDFVGSIVGILISIPLILVSGFLIFIEDPGPIFFVQKRVGKNGKNFNMFKLRSMRLGSQSQDNHQQSTLKNDPRMLKVGRFIRKYNIDETPQFFNVLMGQMSLVGPRPERPFHSKKLSSEIPYYNQRLRVKPGMTGLAQIKGYRGDTDLNERIRLDLLYMENWAVFDDINIMLRTIFNFSNAY
ncbi:MAG: exopolysaccharide biosynthesis polyprenyl glycosylphosphotransferase [Verrucomicrobiota bacterium]